MKFTLDITAACISLLATTTFALPGPEIHRRAVSQELFQEFVRAAQLSHGAYQNRCASPVGTTRLYTIRNSQYDTDGFISRDDSRKEIVVAFRGTGGILDAIIDLRNTLVPYTSPGADGCTGCTVHQGFQQQWNAVAAAVVSQLRTALGRNPDYTITITGHSLGGALTTMSAPTIAKAFPGKVTAYSLASPRVGNPAFIAFVEALVPKEKLFRLTHTDDNVPQDLTPAEGYRHMATEYWMSTDPVTAENIVQCDGGEDPTCNVAHATANAGLTGINEAHFNYMNIDFSADEADC